VVAQSPRAIDDAALRNAGQSEEWLTYGHDLGEKRFSPLKQIDASNVGRLGLAWAYDIPGTFGNPPGGGNQEATPIVWNGNLYSITNWSVVFAVDARTGKQLWTWDPQVNRPAVQPKVCCGIVSRGVAIYDGKIIAPILDGRLVALDALTGKPVWEARVAYPQEQYTLTMAPRIAKGKVIIGASGAEYPVRGFVDGYDAQTGHRAWRFFTVPGDPAKGFENAAMKMAAATWDGEWWKMGGGATVWDGLAYDPDANLIYFGTGNGGPWPEVLRGSTGKDNLFVCSIIALNPDNGEMKWYYQVVPTDSWDFDSVQQLTLADLNVGGQTRRTIMQANKNGFYYVLDRLTGQFITAAPFAELNWARGVDPETGRPLIRPEAYYDSKSPVTITPGPGGAHNWAPMSINPDTGLVYIPTSLGSSRTYVVTPDFEYREGMRNTGAGFGGRGAAAGGGAGVTGAGGRGGDAPAATPAGVNPSGAAGAVPAPAPKPLVPPSIGPTRDGRRGGVLVAWDPVRQQERWHREGGGSIGGGTVTTAGNLVFQVLGDGRLVAYTADNGNKVLDVQTGQRSGMGPPITYMIDGRQYVTVMGGRGTGAPATGAGQAGQTAGQAGQAGQPGQAGQAPAAGQTTPAGQGGAAAPTASAPPRVITFVLDGKAPMPGAQ
jgi:PQQ-dependent dehydrogenase (methanol/ethanol family)